MQTRAAPQLEEHESLASISLSELVRLTHEHVKHLWPQHIWVRGELSQVKRYPSGHVYLTLKDNRCTVAGVIFAGTASTLRELPQEGEAVTVCAEPTIYKAAGRFQLIIHDVRKRGRGQLYEQYLLLKQRLQEAGWFAAERKRLIPTVPTTIAIVVSAQGAAWQDVRKTLKLRFPRARLALFAAPAQGTGAAPKIAAAISHASVYAPDVILLCRGGGSFEDLACYNDEAVATAIFNCSIPVITGIGHATDETIADFVADYRAATPTAAAIAAVPDRIELLAQLAALARHARTVVWQRHNDTNQWLDDLSGRLRRNVYGIVTQTQRDLLDAQRELSLCSYAHIDRLKQQLNRASTVLAQRLRLISHSSSHLNSVRDRLCHAVKSILHNQHHSMLSLQQRLFALSPQHTLARGYTLVTDTHGKPVVSVTTATDDNAAVVTFADGSRAATFGPPVPSPDFFTDGPS